MPRPRLCVARVRAACTRSTWLVRPSGMPPSDREHSGGRAFVAVWMVMNGSGIGSLAWGMSRRSSGETLFS